MRPLLAAPVVALTLPLALSLAGCGTDSAAPDAASTPSSAPAVPSSPDTSGPPDSPSSSAPAVPTPGVSPTGQAATPACAQVREGIALFNQGDFEGTVARFKAAIPLARKQRAADDSRASADLLEAVIYYAGLKPAEYPVASASSQDFAKYKTITLGQCQPVPDESPGVTA